MKILITNDIEKYWKGKTDGIQLKDITKREAETLRKIAEKCGKVFKVLEDG